MDVAQGMSILQLRLREIYTLVISLLETKSLKWVMSMREPLIMISRRTSRSPMCIQRKSVLHAGQSFTVPAAVQPMHTNLIMTSMSLTALVVSLKRRE